MLFFSSRRDTFSSAAVNLAGGHETPVSASEVATMLGYLILACRAVIFAGFVVVLVGLLALGLAFG